MSLAPPAELLDHYGRLSRGDGFVDLGSGSTIELTGTDRQKFFNGFCTNDVARLTPGSGCEAFVTNVQGKTLAHVLVTCRDDSLALVTVPNQAATLVAHLERYHIREQVEIHDSTAERSYIWVGGSTSSPSLHRLFEALGVRKSFAETATTHMPIQVTPTSGAGLKCCLIAGDQLSGTPSYLIEHAPADASALFSLLNECELVACDRDALNMLRLEAGFPLFGVDFNDSNLPQEIARNQQAISFTKGCYLGQETVARIDALGHVNRTLVGLTFPRVMDLAFGTELRSGEAQVGRVTSVAYSPRLNAGVAFAIIRRGKDSPGSQLESPSGQVKVIELPLTSSS